MQYRSHPLPHYSHTAEYLHPDAGKPAINGFDPLYCFGQAFHCKSRHCRFSACPGFREKQYGQRLPYYTASESQKSAQARLFLRPAEKPLCSCHLNTGRQMPLPESPDLSPLHPQKSVPFAGDFSDMPLDRDLCSRPEPDRTEKEQLL